MGYVSVEEHKQQAQVLSILFTVINCKNTYITFIFTTSLDEKAAIMTRHGPDPVTLKSSQSCLYGPEITHLPQMA